jgi:hypothetical protein
MEFEIKTTYTFEEYRNFVKAVNLNINKFKGRLILSLALFAGSIAFLFITRQTQLAIFATAFVVIFLIAMFFLARSSVKKSWETNTLLQNVVNTYHFSEEQIDVYSDIGNTVLSYDKVYKLIENENDFYIMTANNTGFIVSKKEMTEEQAEFIRQHCNK